MRDGAESSAKQCLFGFLKDTSNVYDLKTRIISYHKRVSKLQGKMKDYLFKYEYRLGALEEVWEKLKADLIKESLSKKAPKKLKLLVPKLAAMSDEMRRRTLKTYLERQILRHQFLSMEQNYRDNVSAYPDAKVREDYILRTLAKRDRMLEISDWVFKGLDFKEDPYIINCTA